jgi:hypothetical protein
VIKKFTELGLTKGRGWGWLLNLRGSNDYAKSLKLLAGGILLL